MYEAYFELIERPFAATPQIEHYFPARTIEAARRTLVRCIDRAEGSGVLIGPSGTGKSLVCQLLRHQFRDSFEVVLLGDVRLDSPRALLQTILFGLHLPCRGMDDGDMRLSLIDHLTRGDQSRNGLLLVADEAHTLAAKVLEEIRLISNVSVDGQPRVRFVMAGAPSLEEHLASPRLESFSQRTAARAYLEPLDRAETIKYMIAQLAAAGGDARTIFADSAYESVYRATDGVPRLINQVCDHALVLAFAGGIERLGEREIEEAWADLQQLPTPWSSPAAPTKADDEVVQFGELDDELDAIEPAPMALRLAPVDEPEVERDVEQQLDDVEARLNALCDEAEQAMAPLPVEQPCEATSVTAAAGTDPFGENFAEEEVIVDRFSTAHAAVWDQMPHVYSSEGRVLSALLETLVETSQPMQSVDASGLCATQERDLIIVEDDPPTIPVTSSAPQAVRQEYSQLFARMRRG